MTALNHVPSKRREWVTTKESEPPSPRMRFHSGFTLIELLVVVAIILILLAIALPKYNSMMIRAKVAASSQEVRVLVTALTSYQIDWQVYPIDHHGDWPHQHPEEYGFTMLTTPIQYLSEWLLDPFFTTNTINPKVQNIDSSYYGGSGSDNTACGGRAHYSNRTALDHGVDCAHAFIVFGIGPDKERSVSGRTAFPSGDQGYVYPVGITAYSPSNGTKSEGDILRLVGDWHRKTISINGIRGGT